MTGPVGRKPQFFLASLPKSIAEMSDDELRAWARAVVRAANRKWGTSIRPLADETADDDGLPEA